MMKKLLVLSLVLGIASLATAGLQFSIGGTQYADGSTVLVGGQTAVGIYNDTAFTGPSLVQWIGIETDQQVEGTATVNNDLLPGTWSITDYGTFAGYPDTWYWYTNQDLPAVGDTLVGDLFTVEGLPDATITLYDSQFTSLGSVNLVTPEPVTMALLGLGGLMIRRKK
jgi:hypothetical protein